VGFERFRGLVSMVTVGFGQGERVGHRFEMHSGGFSQFEAEIFQIMPDTRLTCLRFRTFLPRKFSRGYIMKCGESRPLKKARK
jgi:hypothetical protein